MSLSSVPFVAIKPLPILVAMLSAALLTGCGKDKEEDTRVDRAVVVKLFGVQTVNGTAVKVLNGPWQRPAATITPVLLKGEESTLCDVTSTETTATTEIPVDKDSLCYVKDACVVSTGKSQYTSDLGTFQLTFINNSTKVEQNMLINGMGVNITIYNAAGAEVFNFTRDNLDYQDWLEEVANLRTADTSSKCKDQNIFGVSDGVSLPANVKLGTSERPFEFTLTTGNAEDIVYNFTWNGKDSSGNDVLAGTYTAHFDITITDATTNESWEDPAPVTFEIRD